MSTFLWFIIYGVGAISLLAFCFWIASLFLKKRASATKMRRKTIEDTTDDEVDKKADKDKKSDKEKNLPATPYSGGWKKLGWLLVTCSVIGLTITGIYWGVQKIDHGMPEKKEFSAYYHLQETNLDGSYSGSGTVLVTVTPNAIRYGFVSPQGGNVSNRWTRDGGGVWTRVFGGNSFGSWLRIKNVSSNPDADFEEWKHTILEEDGDDTDPTKSYKISLTR